MESPFTNRLPRNEVVVEPTSMPMVPSRGPSDLPSELENTDLKLGFINKFLFRKEASHALRQKMAQISHTYMEKQRAEIVQRLMLDLDINKKKAFEEYMEKVGYLNRELIKKSNDMERDLRGMLREEVAAIFQEKRSWEEQIDSLGLSEDERQGELIRMNEWIEFARSQVEGKLSTLVETHSASLKVTLELLRDAAIGGREALDLE